MVDEHKGLGDVSAAQMNRSGKIDQISADWQVGNQGVDLGMKLS